MTLSGAWLSGSDAASAIHNRIDKSVALILEHFGGVELSIEVVDEPAGRILPNFLTERAMAGLTRSLTHTARCGSAASAG
ncbi:hypothetical protein [Bradyrhizobium sp. USDA 4504]